MDDKKTSFILLDELTAGSLYPSKDFDWDKIIPVNQPVIGIDDFDHLDDD